MLISRLRAALRSVLHNLLSEQEAPPTGLDHIQQALNGLAADLEELRTRQSQAWGEWQLALAEAQNIEQTVQLVLDSGEALEVEKILSQQRAALAMAESRRKDFQELASLGELILAEYQTSQARLETLFSQRQAIASAQQAAALLESLTRLRRDLHRFARDNSFRGILQSDRVQRLADRLAAVRELDSVQQVESDPAAGNDRHRGMQG